MVKSLIRAVGQYCWHIKNLTRIIIMKQTLRLRIKAIRYRLKVHGVEKPGRGLVLQHSMVRR
ncbi:MAG TPA: hypothetical protein VMV04_07925 [Thermodesulfobacteriota bacterium]|nr:hypothetical protein [Thermodesulfobacteriota bacterium]